MKATLKLWCLSVCLFLSSYLFAQFNEKHWSLSLDEQTNIAQLLDNFSQGKIPPFSFTLGGRKSSEFIKDWAFRKETKSIDKNKTEHTFTYSDPKTGLVIRCICIAYSDYPVIEWVLKIKNNSKSNSPVLDNIKTIDSRFIFDGKKNFIFHTSRGSNAERVDFAPIDITMIPDTTIKCGPDQGRSSDTDVSPFFNIDAGDEGIIGSVGWTGRWLVTAKLTDGNIINFTTGFRKVHTYLLPDEEIRTPKILMLYWKGQDRMTGHNQFRRFLLKHYLPQKDGKPFPGPFTCDAGCWGPAPCNENSCTTELYALATLDRYRQFDWKLDAYWIDAGWYEGSDESWWKGVGNWIPNKKNFPNGLRPIADAAKKIGMGFVLWFEPERVYKDTRIDREHPEWVIKIKNNSSGLFNLGNPDARKWLTDMISDFIDKEGITVYRQDFNFDPLPYWQSMDKPDRVGMTEIRHIEGLYAFWDELHVRHPGLLIDNCSSGGRRLDLETISRSLTLTRTDYDRAEPNGQQCQTYGLNFYLPCSGTINVDPATYKIRSAYGSSLLVQRSFEKEDYSLSHDKTIIEEYKRCSPYFSCDYYPLTDYDYSDEAFMSYQFNRPEFNDGIIFAFRRNGSNNKTITVKPKGLKPDSNYDINFEDYGIILTKSGKDIMEKGFDIKIPEAPGSLLISYKVAHN